MDLSNLKPAKGSVRTNKRVGRGYGSGNGKTAGRGMNGARSRAGYSKKIGFEGGQMPLYRRIPKFGFKNHSRVEYSAVNLDTLEKLSKETGITEFNLAVLAEHGLVSSKDLIKVLGRGEISSALKVEAHAFSAKAKEMIEAKGGSVSVTGRLAVTKATAVKKAAAATGTSTGAVTSKKATAVKKVATTAATAVATGASTTTEK